MHRFTLVALSLSLIGLVGLGALVAPAAADIIAYSGSDRFAESIGDVTVRHEHDWNDAKRDIDIFDRSENDFSWIEIEGVEETGSTRLPSPALDHLWISEDGAWIVGLSNLMYLNPVQLVVWERTSKRVAAKVRVAPGGTIVPGHIVSTTNATEWFDEKEPNVALEFEDGAPVALSVDGNEGRLRLRLSDGELLEPADWTPRE